MKYRKRCTPSISLLSAVLILSFTIFLASCKKDAGENLLIEDQDIFLTETVENTKQTDANEKKETGSSEEEPHAAVEQIELIAPIEEEGGNADYDLYAGGVVRSDLAYYYLEPIPVSQTYQALIHRIDRETGKDRILCTKVGCSHDSPDCDAFLSGTGSLIQRYQNFLILQDLGVLTSVPVGFQGHQEIFLKLPYSELRDLLDTDDQYFWPQVVLHRGIAAVSMTKQGEFTGTGYNREEEETEEESSGGNPYIRAYRDEFIEQVESRYDYTAAVCVIPFENGETGEVKALIQKEIPDVSQVRIKILPYGDELYILLESVLSEACYEMNADGSGGGGGSRDHVNNLEIYRYRLDAEEAELLYQGSAPLDGLCGATVDGNAIRFLGLRDAMEEEQDGFCDYLITGFDLSEKRFYDPVSLFSEEEYAARPVFGDGYIAAVTYQDPYFLPRGMLDGNEIKMKDIGASVIHMYDYSGKELDRFDFDMLVPDSVGKTLEFHYAPFILTAGKEELVIETSDYSAYHAGKERIILSLQDGEMKTPERQ